MCAKHPCCTQYRCWTRASTLGVVCNPKRASNHLHLAPSNLGFLQQLTKILSFFGFRCFIAAKFQIGTFKCAKSAPQRFTSGVSTSSLQKRVTEFVGSRHP